MRTKTSEKGPPARQAVGHMDKIQKYTFVIDEETQSTRLDLVLSLQLGEVSRSFIQKLIDQGQVSVDGKVCRLKKYKVSLGDNSATAEGTES